MNIDFIIVLHAFKQKQQQKTTNILKYKYLPILMQ